MSAAAPTPRFVAGNIPAPLKALPNWVNFRTYPKPDGRLGKMPLVPGTGRAAKIDDPATWLPYGEAVAAASAHDLWLGFAIAADLNLTLIDRDGVVGGDGAVDAPTARMVADLDSYAERSASRRGVHVVCKGHPPADCAKPPGVEVYPGRRFVVLTGDLLPGLGRATIEDRTDRLAALLPRRRAAPAANQARPSFLSDAEVIEKARGAKDGAAFDRLFLAGDMGDHGGDDSAADLALCSHLTFWSQDCDQVDRLFRRSGLYREKWGRDDYRRRTIAKALERDEVYSPVPRIVASERDRAAEDGGPRSRPSPARAPPGRRSTPPPSKASPATSCGPWSRTPRAIGSPC